MDIREIDPLTHPGWTEFLQRHGAASAFHTASWLQSLQLSYGYKPRVLATFDPDGSLRNALVFCHVDSWLTGRRLVSLPFSDHCQPLIENEEALAQLTRRLLEVAQNYHCKYVELRPTSALKSPPAGFSRAQQLYLHNLDLRPGATEVFRQFHRNCIQRKIRRAEKERLRIAEGTTPEILEKFYGLLLKTRRRHGLPPQPFAWFRDLANCMRNSLLVRLAYTKDEPVAGILTLEHRKTLTYKYGGSDERFHNLGGMPYLFWTAIQSAFSRGFEEMDLGRSDFDNPGLIAFKEHLGARRSVLSYWRSPVEKSKVVESGWKLRLLGRACRMVPDNVLTAAGSLLYKHIA